jgi:hypothetical protein
MSTQRYPGPQNLLPEATGQIIEFIRKPSEFAINSYAQYVETKSPYGVYAQVDSDQPVRIISDADFAFADGDARPTGNANLMTFQWTPFRTQRRSYPWTLGDQTIETQKSMSKIDWTQQEAGQVASQAMTNRTNRVIGEMQDTSNWGDNTANVNVINGGYGSWRNASSDPGSASYLAIKRSIGNACKVINLKTNGKVRRKHLKLILSPGAAEMMGDTSEIYDYLKYGPAAKAAQRGEYPNANEDWGLPDLLYGVEVVVEDSPIITVPPSVPWAAASITTGQRSYIKNDSTAVLVSRVGGIEGAYGAPSFSTVQIYFYGAPMQAETFPSKKDRRTEGFLTEEYFEVIAAPASGFLFTGINS